MRWGAHSMLMRIRVQRLAAVVDLDGDVGAVLGQPLGHLPGLARARPLALDQGDELVVVAQELARAARRWPRPSSRPRPRPRRVTGPSSRRCGSGPAGPVASRTARVTSPATTRRADSAMDAALSSAPASGSYSSSAANPSTIPLVGTTRTVLVASSHTCMATGRMLSLFGQQHDLVGGDRLDDLEDLRRRRVHRLAARPRGSARPATGRSGRCPRRWPPPPRPSAAGARCRRRRWPAPRRPLAPSAPLRSARRGR